MIIFRGMDILKNDVQAILGQIFEMKLKENKRFSTMTPGLDKKVKNFYIIYRGMPNMTAPNQSNRDRYE